MIYWPIFTNVLPWVGNWSKITDLAPPPFSTAQGTLPWQPILGSKLTKSDCSPLFVALLFRNGLKYRHSDFKRFIRDDMAINFVNLVNFGPVTLEFKRVKGVHPVVSSFKINISDKLSQIHGTNF